MPEINKATHKEILVDSLEAALNKFEQETGCEIYNIEITRMTVINASDQSKNIVGRDIKFKMV